MADPGGRDVANEHNLIFTTKRGTPLDERNVLRMHYAVLKAAGLRRVSFHALRHQAGTDMIAAGLDDRKVMAVLGHSSIRVTKDTYVHPRFSEADAATVDRMAQRRATGGSTE